MRLIVQGVRFQSFRRVRSRDQDIGGGPTVVLPVGHQCAATDVS